MKPSELLIKAKAVIADPKHWTQGKYAKDAEGIDVGPAEPTAVCWCSVGAVDKVALEGNTYNTRFAALRYLSETAEKLGYSGMPEFNDSSSHEIVMKAWDAAIKLAKEDENEDR